MTLFRPHVTVHVPAGTSLAAHDVVMHEVEGQLLDVPEIKSGILSASIGGGSGGPFGGGTAGATSGSVSVDVGNKSLRKRGIKAIAEEVPQRLATGPGAIGQKHQMACRTIARPPLRTRASVANHRGRMPVRH